MLSLMFSFFLLDRLWYQIGLFVVVRGGGKQGSNIIGRDVAVIGWFLSALMLNYLWLSSGVVGWF